MRKTRFKLMDGKVVQFELEVWGDTAVAPPSYIKASGNNEITSMVDPTYSIILIAGSLREEAHRRGWQLHETGKGYYLEE